MTYPKNIIMKTVAGSHLYGTNIKTSDIDYRGVCLEPMTALLGNIPFDQYINPDGDETIFGLRKFVQLALDNNPNIVELLFAPKPIYQNAYWTEIIKVREYFLSRKIAKTFVGYAVSQAKRIKTHYDYMTGTTPEKPEPKDYGRILFSDGSEQWTDYHKKQEYDNDLKRYQNYQTWLKNRNPARHELEEKWGYDTKHGMHLVRLLQQGEELIKTGNLTLPRPNAEILLEIRNGSLPYEKLMIWMNGQIKTIDIITENSPLPAKPNFNKVHEVVMNLNYLHVHRSYP